jgi:hypothetical protein
MPANARGAVSILIAVLFMTYGLDQFDFVPVGFHLVSDHLRQRGADALPHFGAVAVNLDDAVVANIDVNVRCYRCGGFRSGSNGFLLRLASCSKR